MIYKEPLESPEHMSDQAVLPNLNAEWVNAKGMEDPLRTFSTRCSRAEWEVFSLSQ